MFRLLYNNFRKKYPDIKLKELMWKGDTASYVNVREKAMIEIEEVNEDSFKHLIKIPPRF